MKKTIGMIVKVAASDIIQRPILGKTCFEHVQSAMKGAGAILAENDAAFDQPFDRVLLVREDAPSLSVDTLASLMNAASATGASSGTLLSQNTQEPLAMVLPRDKWLAAYRPQSAAPAEIARKLFSVRDEQAASAPLSLNTNRATAPETCFAVCDAASYAASFRLLREALIEKHMKAGVIVLDPATTIIEADVQIGPGTVIYPGNILQGRTVIGGNCTLYPNSRMQNAVIGDETTVENSVVLDAVVGSYTTVGPFAYLRPATKVGDHCRIGDFVEIKNSSIDDGTKVSHLTYVGDSDLGKDINLGCGVVFVNYDGKAKNRSVVDDHAFIGCNCNLVAPVHIGENAYLAAGSTVVEDVPKDALFVARSRGTIKEDWVKKRKEAGKL